jgi:hypothetical protein
MFKRLMRIDAKKNKEIDKGLCKGFLVVQRQWRQELPRPPFLCSATFGIYKGCTYATQFILSMVFILSKESVGSGIGLFITIILLRYMKEIGKSPRKPGNLFVDTSDTKVYRTPRRSSSTSSIKTVTFELSCHAQTVPVYKRDSYLSSKEMLAREKVDPAGREKFSLKSYFVLLFAGKLKYRYRQVKERRRMKSSLELKRGGVRFCKLSK